MNQIDMIIALRYGTFEKGNRAHLWHRIEDIAKLMQVSYRRVAEILHREEYGLP